MKSTSIKTLLHALLIFIGLLSLNAQAGVEITYIHNDALGSPVAGTDEQGNVKWRSHYQPYGEEVLGERQLFGVRTGYTGHRDDPETGLTYMGARYYSPTLGRFMGVDPAGVSDSNIHSFNRYAYANNNTYRFVDPDGRAAIAPKFGGGLGGGGPLNSYGGVGGVRGGVGFGSVPRSGPGATGTNSTVAKGGGQTFERVVSNAELKATQQTGLLRGGRQGENFFTNSASLDAKRAQQRLGLDGPLRDARIRFKVTNDVNVTGPRPAAPGRTGTAGGGREFSTTGRTEIEILRIDPLRK